MKTYTVRGSFETLRVIEARGSRFARGKLTRSPGALHVRLTDAALAQMEHDQIDTRAPVSLMGTYHNTSFVNAQGRRIPLTTFVVAQVSGTSSGYTAQQLRDLRADAGFPDHAEYDRLWAQAA